MFRLLDTMVTLLVLGMVETVLRLVPLRYFGRMQDRLAALWLDMRNVPVLAGGATDTQFGIVRYFDDFVRIVIDSATASLYNVNADGGGTAFAINLQHNGVIRGTGDGTDGDITNIFGPIAWRCDQGGPMTLEIRLTLITSLANGEQYIGWTDANTDENPITLSTADVVTANADDAVGFAFTGAGTADWKTVSVNATAVGSVARANNKGPTTPVLTTWQTFKVVLNVDGDADYYIDGVFQGREDLAVTPTVLLGLCVAQQEGGTARSTDIDYVYTSAGRS